MRFVKKENLSYKNGYIVDVNGNVMALNDKVVRQVNEFNRLCDLLNFVHENEAKIDLALGEHELPKYEPSMESRYVIESAPKTPKLDEHTKNIEDIIEEIDNKERVEGCSLIINDRFLDLLEFCEEDEVIVQDAPSELPRRMLTNPLEIEGKHIILAVREFCENKEEIDAVTE